MFGMSDESNCKASIVKPRCTFEDLTYPKNIREKIKELIDEEPFAHALIEEGLHPKRKIYTAHRVAVKHRLPMR